LSFRLIGHFVDRLLTFRGSLVAYSVNRYGDVSLLFLQSKVLSSIESINTSSSIYLDILLFSMSMKSVSILSFLWLPDAMEGPTPVSALLHSATLVLTGLLYYLRFVDSILLSVLIFILSFGTLSISYTSMLDADIKKVAAISTSTMISWFWSEVILSSSVM